MNKQELDEVRKKIQTSTLTVQDADKYVRRMLGALDVAEKSMSKLVDTIEMQKGLLKEKNVARIIDDLNMCVHYWKGRAEKAEEHSQYCDDALTMAKDALDELEKEYSGVDARWQELYDCWKAKAVKWRNKAEALERAIKEKDAEIERLQAENRVLNEHVGTTPALPT